MTTLLLTAKSNIHASKNIALSPVGYWPQSRWQRFCFKKFGKHFRIKK